MRRVTRRFANRGTGPEFIRVVPRNYTIDEDFNPVLNNNATPGDPTDAPLGPPILAAVSRSKGVVVPAAGSGTGSAEAVFMYSITLYTDTDPQIAEGQRLVWESRTVRVDASGSGAIGPSGETVGTPRMAVAMERDLVAASGAVMRAPGSWVVGAKEVGGLG